ncbi:MAG: pyridoxal phosphate-dependent aminotransferase [Acidobacteria bacterium]|nr:pyridoxal phosphate-dependent aminotransferase [Acidobacteriota bacterium]
MQFTREALEARESTLIQIAMAADEVPNPFRLYYGESDMPTPEFICRAVYDAVRNGHTLYTPTAGHLELREAICRKFHELHGVEYRPSEVVCTVGAGMTIFLAIRATIGAGDNAIIISPAFSVFASTVTVFGGEVRGVPLTRDGKRFRLDIDRVKRAIDGRTRLLVVNSPSNPTGWVITHEEQEALWDLAVKHDFLIMSDEVYERIVFDGPVAPSFAKVATDREHLLVVNSFSKTYNMTGWRLGYAIGDERIIKLMTKVEEFIISSPPAMIQQAGIVALRDGEPYVQEIRDRYAQRRKIVMDRISQMPGLSVPTPQGAFYVFPQVNGVTDSMAFARKLLKETGVAIAPGMAFGPHGEGYIRISFASSEEVLVPALELLQEFMQCNPS